MEKIDSVLIIDDDEISNFLTKDLLQRMNIAKEIGVAVNGQEGVNWLQDHCHRDHVCPNLIFLDINMPVMNGFEFLDSYRNMHFANKEEVTIAVLSSSSSDKDMEKMKSMGIEHYLNKPLTQEKIFTLLSPRIMNQ